MKSILKVKGLHVEIPLAAGPLNAVRDVGFEMKRGETVALVGESGCGKSLTALSLMDLLPRSAKRRAEVLLFNEQDLLKTSEREMADIRGNQMAMVFQEPMTSLNPCYTIGDQLEEAFMQHRKASRSETRKRAVQFLDRVGITAATSRLRQYPHQLSGGLRQRVMIAMALMCGPSLMIADEPTTALDVTIQAQILSLLASLQKEFEMGLILITHDLGIVARMADRVIVMYCGQVVETGSAVDLFENPLHPYTRGLLDCIPVLGKTKPGEHLGSIPGLVPTPIGELVGCSFYNRCSSSRPECAVELIEVKEISPGRSYRCLLSPDVCFRERGGEATR
ncbi:MAG: ABC transporter ATP-binding protein [Deltaproteobacteria bacterium]|nr:ABC transporter ATP-binding protein [Deltaproteobacteria bacterium]